MEVLLPVGEHECCNYVHIGQVQAILVYCNYISFLHFAAVMGRTESLPALDGGWGWVIVFAASLSQFIFSMICRGNGVFFLEFMERFGQSATATSWVLALKMTLWSGLGTSMLTNLT